MAIDVVPVVSPTGCPTNSEANNEGVLEIAVGQETKFPLDIHTSFQVPLAVGMKSATTPLTPYGCTHTRTHIRRTHIRYACEFIQ